MNLRVLRDRVSLAQVVIAIAAVALGQGVRWYSLAIFALCALWAMSRPPPPEPSRTSQHLWTLAIVVGLGLSALRAFLRLEFLDAGVDFFLLLTIQRLFNRQRAREHMQLLLIGALLMVIAAVINTGINYPILFGAYLLVATMALVVNHLVSEGERLGPQIMHEVVRERSAPLWRASTTVAVIAGVGALVTFLVFPRWGMGVFLRGSLARDATSGFSDEVQLGQFGTIKTDATVVMHLKPISEIERDDRVTWYLRGSSFDRYDEGRWYHSKKAEAPKLMLKGPFYALAPVPPGSELGVPSMDLRRVRGVGRGAHRVPRARPVEGFAAATETLHVTVTLEDIGAGVVFAASEPLAVRLRKRGILERRTVRLWGGPNRELRIAKPPGPIQYEFVSRLGRPTRDELEAVGNPPVPEGNFRRNYADLEQSPSVSSRVEQLALDITKDAETRIEKVEAVMRYLDDFDYTLELEPFSEQHPDPLEGFLFETKKGHCEYFASAMAILLRAADVPTRNVNGYYGAHWNELGNFYAVRQADAHSWVEVHFDRLGWVTFDPTPPSGRTAGDAAPFWPAGAKALDAARNLYLEYVIDYNLSKQRAILEELGLRKGGQRPAVAWRGVLGWTVFGVFGLVILVRALRYRRGARVAPAARIYARLLARLRRRGLEREPAESPLRFAERVREGGAAEGEALIEFARRYQAIRFGREVTMSELAELREAARAVLRRKS